MTNILSIDVALNAAIETARTGEHDKGFAVVVAKEQKLEERSQVAATVEEMSSQAENLQQPSAFFNFGLKEPVIVSTIKQTEKTNV